MENEFEKFVSHNRGQFEKGAPSPEVWKKLEAGLAAHRQTNTPVFNLRRTRWIASASVLLMVGMAALLFQRDFVVTPGINEGTVAFKKGIKADSTQKAVDLPAQSIPPKRENLGLVPVDDRELLLYRFRRLVEKRQIEVGRLQKNDPDLYRETRVAVDSLNSIFVTLKQKLPGSIDRNKVLDYMITNLQLQEKILTNQLLLIREIQQPNDPPHEKNSKEI